MDLTIAGASVSRNPNNEQLARVNIELAAFDGEVGISQVTLDDTAGSDDYEAGDQFKVAEAGVTLVNGWIVDQTQTRGATALVARESVYSIQDSNALLHARRVLKKRPAETDVARILNFAASDLSADTIKTWVLNANTVTMEAKHYQTDGWDELIGDVVELTGKTVFLHETADGTRCLHYHALTTGHTAQLSISDVASAVNGTTVFAPGNPARSKTGVDIANDIKVRDQRGREVHKIDATSVAAHDADGLDHSSYIEVEAQSQAELETIATALIAELKDEATTYTCTIGPLDVGGVAKVRVGDFVTVTSQVMGLTASAQRISHMTLTPFSGKDGKPVPTLWDATLELGYPIRRGRRRFKNKAKAPDVINDAPLDPGSVNTTITDDFNRSQSGTWGEASSGVGNWNPNGGNTEIPILSVNGDEGVFYIAGGDLTNAGMELTFDEVTFNDMRFEGHVVIDSDGVDFYCSMNGTGDLSFLLSVNQDTDVWTLEVTDLGGTNSDTFAAAFTVESDPFYVHVWRNGDEIDANVYTGAEPGSPLLTVALDPGDQTSVDSIVIGGYGPGGSQTAYIDNLDIEGAQGIESGPRPGQTYYEQVEDGDASRTEFHTTYQYRIGTVKVYVAGLRLGPGDFDQSTPTTRTVTLNDPPALDVIVTIEYEGGP